MIRKLGRLFVIKTRFEAYAIIYALALGAAERGSAYMKLWRLPAVRGHGLRGADGRGQDP